MTSAPFLEICTSVLRVVVLALPGPLRSAASQVPLRSARSVGKRLRQLRHGTSDWTIKRVRYTVNQSAFCLAFFEFWTWSYQKSAVIRKRARRPFHWCQTWLGTMKWKKIADDDVFTKCARHVGILNSLRKKLSKRCLTRIYKGYIRPRLEYACAVWSGGNTSKLLKLQQKFCRQHQVQLPNLSNRFKFHTLTLFYKIRNGLAPTYLSEILPETLALSSGRNLRRHVYPFPRINKSSTMQSFLPRATVFWNELPASIQSSSSLHSFKAKLRDLLKI